MHFHIFFFNKLIENCYCQKHTGCFSDVSDYLRKPEVAVTNLIVNLLIKARIKVINILKQRIRYVQRRLHGEKIYINGCVALAILDFQWRINYFSVLGIDC